MYLQPKMTTLKCKREKINVLNLPVFCQDDPDLFSMRGIWPTPDAKPPPDIPLCGFDGEKCVVEDYNYSTSRVPVYPVVCRIVDSHLL